jgi:hypothetical protein
MLRVARMLRLPLITGLMVGVLCTPAPALARSAWFRTPSGDMRCVATLLGTRSASLRCDLRFIGRRAVFLPRRRRASIRRVRRLLTLRRPVTLVAGRRRSFGPFSCIYKQRNLSCRSPFRHGFTVGRKFRLVY